MKKTLVVAIVILTIVASLAFSSGQAEGSMAEKPITIRMGIVESFENPIGKMAVEFKRLIEENSGGKLKVEVFPSMQLGGIREMVEATQMGNQEIVVCTPAWISSFVPQMSVMSFPFLFKDVETAYRLVDGVVGDELVGYAKEKGFQILGFPAVGYRQLTNNIRPITKLEDFTGLKIRLQGDPVHIATFKALGANPVSMSFAELYSALQQKVVDGQENTTTNIYLNKFNEVQKYFSYTNIFYDSWVILMNKGTYDKLSPELQAVMKDAAAKAIKLERELVVEADANYAAMLEKSMNYNSISEQEMNRIVEKARTVYTQFNDVIGADLIQKVLSAVK